MEAYACSVVSAYACSVVSKESQTMIHVVLSVGVLTLSALLIRRESRTLARIEANRRARGLEVLTTGCRRR
jgi:hypothetical protein